MNHVYLIINYELQTRISWTNKANLYALPHTFVNVGVTDVISDDDVITVGNRVVIG